MSIVPQCVHCAQLCPTPCDPMGCNLPGSSVDGIYQARILEWIPISFSRGSSQPRDWTRVSYVSGIAGRFLSLQSSTCWAVRKALYMFFVVVPYQLKKSQIESDQRDYLMVERYKKDGSHHQPTMFEEFFYRSWWKDNWIHHREALMVGSDREDTCQLISCYWYP